jgi:hypothetical protein
MRELGQQTDRMPVVEVDIPADTPKSQIPLLIREAVIAKLSNNALVTRWPEHMTGTLQKGTDVMRYKVAVETQTLGDTSA